MDLNKLWAENTRKRNVRRLAMLGSGSSYESNQSQFPSGSSLQITPGAIVCVEAELRGDVRIGARSVIHPCAKILATEGPIILGESNIVEELAVIENKSKEPMIIGNNNVFEVRARVFATVIGDHNVFEGKCVVGEAVRVGNGCSFGSGTQVTASIEVPDNSVFFGEPLRHRIAGDRPPIQNLQIDFLSRVLPNYHHIKTPATRTIISSSPPVQSLEPPSGDS